MTIRIQNDVYAYTSNIIMSTINNLHVVSYNCAGVKNKLPIISKMSNESNIIFLQETWLLPNELGILNGINSDFNSFSISSVDLESGVLVGRPYGGLSVMWNKCLSPVCQVVTFDDNRILGITITIDAAKYLLINV